MVPSIIRNLVLVTAVIFSTPTFGFSQRLYDDGSLAVRGEELYSAINARDFYSDLDAHDLDNDFDVRNFYEANKVPSVREYIDDQINLALRSYDEAFQELYRRHTAAEIASRIEEWTDHDRKAKNVLGPARQRVEDAKQALKKDPNNKELKQEYRWAKNNLDTIRGSIGGADEAWEYWNAQTAGLGRKPGPQKASSSPSRHPSPKKGGHHSSH